jgi:hypothetical protein
MDFEKEKPALKAAIDFHVQRGEDVVVLLQNHKAVICAGLVQTHYRFWVSCHHKEIGAWLFSQYDTVSAHYSLTQTVLRISQRSCLSYSSFSSSDSNED